MHYQCRSIRPWANSCTAESAGRALQSQFLPTRLCLAQPLDDQANGVESFQMRYGRVFERANLMCVHGTAGGMGQVLGPSLAY
jgi:hypothetical protein